MSVRVEHIGDATLYLGDASEVLPTLGDGSVEMIWTDPPYGHSNHDGDWNSRLNEHRGIEGQPIANDSPELMRRAVDNMLSEAARVLRADCCCCCCCCCGGGGPRPTFAWLAERMDREGLSFFHSVIWDKINPGLGWRYRRRHEMVMVAHRKGGKLLWQNDSRAVPNIFSLSAPRERFHPNEKPVGLVAHFVELHSSPGALILDPFMGSGTTGVAALQAGRRFIGVELDPAHFETSCRRIEGATRQADMFVERPSAAIQQSMFDPALDSLLSYNAAVEAIGERVKAGERVPDFFRSDKDAAE